jgi:hypothetical protein
MWKGLAVVAIGVAGACVTRPATTPSARPERTGVLVCASTRWTPQGVECTPAAPVDPGVRCLLARVTSPPDSLGKFMMVVEHLGEAGAIVSNGTGDPSLICSPAPDSSLVVVFDTTSTVAEGHAAADRSVRCLLVRLRPRTDLGLHAVATRAFWATTYRGGIECPTQDKTSPVVIDTLWRRQRGR